MASSYGPITLSTAGTAKTFTIGIAATRVRFKAGAKNASSTTQVVVMDGSVDASGYQSCITKTVTNGGQVRDQDFTDRCVSVWEYVSGVWTEVLRANWNSFTATQIKLDVITANVNYSIFVEAEN